MLGGTAKSVQLLKAKLDPAQDGNPASAATGVGFVSVNDLNLTYFMSYDGLSSGVAAAHIHDGARGTSGAPFIFFSPAAGSKSGTVSGTFTLSAAQKARVLGGNTYFNVHTTTFGGGEIRGQIEP